MSELKCIENTTNNYCKKREQKHKQKKYFDNKSDNNNGYNTYYEEYGNYKRKKNFNLDLNNNENLSQLT
jgi:hypothetical protein